MPMIDIYIYVYILIVMPSESFSLSLHLGPFVTFIVGVGTPSFNLPRCTRRRWSAWTARQKRSNSPGKETACVSTSYANLITLPRHARDKHRENQFNKPAVVFFSQADRVGPEQNVAVEPCQRPVPRLAIGGQASRRKRSAEL